MTGKEKCELLKSIRKSIAEMNGIKYKPEPCTHDGDCPGSCPRCDQEAAYLMRELKKKEAAGFPIRIDTESLVDFETLASEPVEPENDHLMGKPFPGWDGNYEPVLGNMASPEIEDWPEDEDEPENKDESEDEVDDDDLLFAAENGPGAG